MHDSTPAPRRLSLFDGKTCNRCHFWRPFAEYHRNCATSDGLHTLCCWCRGSRRPPIPQSFAAADGTVRTDLRCCSTCWQWKPLDAYHKCARQSGGLKTRCKVCIGIEAQERYKVKKDHIIALTLRWRAANPEKVKAIGRRAAKKRRPQANEWRRRYKETHPEYGLKKRDHTHRWRQTHRLQKRQHDADRYRRIVEAGSPIPPKEWIALCEKFGNRCLACGIAGPLTMDHVIPLARGGPHTLSNLQPLCLRCNSRKHTRIIDYRPKT